MSHKDQLNELIVDVREQVLYMKELGVELLADPEPPGQAVEGSSEPDVSASLDDLVVTRRRLEVPKNVDKRPSRLSALPSLSKRSPYVAPDAPTSELVSTGLDASEDKATVMRADALFEVGPTLPQSIETIEGIRADIGDCTRCPLHAGRTQVVHSTGNLNADLMFVGEAPGADEDAQGFPFVGRAGQLLTKIIESIGIKREEVFIGNINRCRPPGNRQPTIEEAHTCRPFLLREVAVVRPKVIVVLGNTALHNLLDTKVGITKVRGQFQDYFGVKVMPTFHPAYLLRDPNKKREVWEDMKKVRDYLKLST